MTTLFFEAPTQRSDGRTLVWGDEFNEGTFNDRLDKFSTKCDTMTPDYKNHVLDCSATDEFIYVEDGKLVLHAKDDGDNTFTTARPLSTYKTMNFQYGYLEMRARVPFGGGFFPSFWMQTNVDPNNGNSFGEIDMFESFGNSRTIHSGIGKWYITGHSFAEMGDKALSGSKEYSFSSQEQAMDWHIYAIEWTPEYIKFFVDGDNYFTASLKDEDNFGEVVDPGMEVFRRPAQVNWNHWLYYNEMVERGFRMDPDVNYEIDYIRLYQYPDEILITDFS